MSDYGVAPILSDHSCVINLLEFSKPRNEKPA